MSINPGVVKMVNFKVWTDRQTLLAVTLMCIFVCGPPDLHGANRAIKIGVYNNNPLIFIDKDHRCKGFFADIIEHIAYEEGWDIEYVFGTFQQGLERLENNRIDILSAIAFSMARAERYDFTTENLLTNWGQLYSSVDSNIKAITDIKDKKISVLKGDIHYSVFTELIGNFGIKCQFIETDDYHSVLQMVSENQADAGVVNRFFGMKFETRFNVGKSGVIFNPIKIHCAAPKGINSDLLATIDTYFSRLKESGNSEYYQALEKWFGAVYERRMLPLWVKWTVAAAAGITVFLFLGNLVLRKRVRAKTKELTLELSRRKQMENALQEANSIINRSPAIAFLWKNMEGWPVEFVSHNVADLFGYSAQDFISGAISYSSTVHPDDLDRVVYEVSTFSANKDINDFEHEPYRIVSKAGEVRWLDRRVSR